MTRRFDTPPPLDSLTFEERLRVAAGRRVASVEERIIDREFDRLRPPDPTGDDWVRQGARERRAPTTAERAESSVRASVDRAAAVEEFDEQVLEAARRNRRPRRRRQSRLRGRVR